MTPSIPRIDHSRYIPSLDGLRGLAIVLVFLHHYYPRQRFNPLSAIASAGWIGVDVFFVLSGFLITGILFETLKAPNGLRDFFVRRSLRLFPLYVVVIGLIVLFAGPLRVPLGWHHVLFLAYGANLSTAFGMVPDFGPYLRFNHLWSLAVEEQFYLLWAPLVFILGNRQRIVVASAVGVAAAILLRGVGVHFFSIDTICQSLPTRMDALLCGALMAMSVRGAHGGAWLTERKLYAALSIGLGILATCFLASRSFYGGKYPTLIVGYVGNDLWCTALLGLALLPGTAVSRLMDRSVLRSIGRYSYGLYLLHEIPGPFFDRLVARFESLFGPLWLSGSIANFLLFCCCLLMAIVSFHAVEKPFLRLKRYFPYRPPQSRKVTQTAPLDLRPPKSSIV